MYIKIRRFTNIIFVRVYKVESNSVIGKHYCEEKKKLEENE